MEQFWEDGTFADTSLKVVVGGIERATYTLHGTIISANSSYFKTRFTSHVGSAKRKHDADASQKFEISVVLDEEQAAAAECVLKCLYTQKLSPSLSASQLFAMIKVSKFQTSNGLDISHA